MLKIIAFHHGSHSFSLSDILKFYFNRYVIKVNGMHVSNHQTSSTYMPTVECYVFGNGTEDPDSGLVEERCSLSLPDENVIVMHRL